MESGSPKSRKSRQQLEAELLTSVQEAEREYRKVKGAAKEAARKKYERALHRFNTLVIDRKMPDGK